MGLRAILSETFGTCSLSAAETRVNRVCPGSWQFCGGGGERERWTVRGLGQCDWQRDERSACRDWRCPWGGIAASVVTNESLRFEVFRLSSVEFNDMWRKSMRKSSRIFALMAGGGMLDPGGTALQNAGASRCCNSWGPDRRWIEGVGIWPARHGSSARNSEFW